MARPTFVLGFVMASIVSGCSSESSTPSATDARTDSVQPADVADAGDASSYPPPDTTGPLRLVILEPKAGAEIVAEPNAGGAYTGIARVVLRVEGKDAATVTMGNVQSSTSVLTYPVTFAAGPDGFVATSNRVGLGGYLKGDPPQTVGIRADAGALSAEITVNVRPPS